MRRGSGSVRARLPDRREFMTAIYVIAVFVIVIAVINRLEYGRID